MPQHFTPTLHTNYTVNMVLLQGIHLYKLDKNFLEKRLKIKIYFEMSDVVFTVPKCPILS